MTCLTIGSLFSGIGGLELGLERTGAFETVWQVEQDDYCRRVLAKHWPDVARFEDVREVGAANLEPVDVICGGFPCQDISVAGKAEGVEGERSGLWSEMRRIIREVRPRYALVENSPALTVRGLGRVLGGLSELGYDAEWSTVSACSVGATHLRRRMFVVAYADGVVGGSGLWSLVQRETSLLGEDNGEVSRFGPGPRMEDASELYRGADGAPTRVDRNRALGNAVVPQVAEWIGSRIVAAEMGAIKGAM